MMDKKNTTKPLKILLSGGGTGGHIYPALALADRLKELHSNIEILYIGTERGLESQLVTKAGYPFKAIQVEGFLRKLNYTGLKYNAKSLVYFLKALKKSRNIIKDYQPDIVVGTGGYVCAPILFQASRLNVPTIVHEQNSVAGITNKFLAPFVDKIAISFEEARSEFEKHPEKVELTGNPRGQEVAHVEAGNALVAYGLSKDKSTVLVFGGSRGAYTINQTLIDSYPELVKREYQVLFVTGSANHKDISRQISDKYGNTSAQNIFIEPYIDNMPQVFKEVDLVVCRSGATTLAEIMSLGLASVLIPSPNVTADHQTKNAMSLVDHQAAKMIKETDLTAELFTQQLDDLMLDKNKRDHMAKQAKALGEPRAADKLIAIMMELVKD